MTSPTESAMSGPRKELDQDGGIERDVVPCQVGGTVSVGNPFKQVIGIRASRQSPGKSPDQGHDVKLPDGM